MKKGIIVMIAAVMCVMFAVNYIFAQPGKVKTEPTAEQKETTTTEEKETTETTTEIKKETTTKNSVEEVATSQNPVEESTDHDEHIDSDTEDDGENEEIDDEKIDSCDHEWVQIGYAVDSDSPTGYMKERKCKKCNLCEFEEVSLEEFEKATKDDQETYDEEGCEYEDNETGMEVVE